MIYGLYLSAQGAQVQSTRQDVIANNLANASTISFKRDLVRAQSHSIYDAEHGTDATVPPNVRNLPGGVTVSGVITDFTEGELVETDVPMDVALAGKGFLHVADGKRHFLTRDGQLAVNAQGALVTRQHGYAVLNDKGLPINSLDQSAPIQFRDDGAVIQSGDNQGTLAVVEPANYMRLEKVGKNMYMTDRVVPAKPGVTVRQGVNEGAAVRPVTEMMELIEASRAFEANTNMIKYQDDSLGRLLGSLPRH